MFKTIRIDRELAEKVRDQDPTGKRQFTNGLMYILRWFFGGKHEKNDIRTNGRTEKKSA
jgi:hypothetical protein